MMNSKKLSLRSRNSKTVSSLIKKKNNAKQIVMQSPLNDFFET